MKKMFHKVLGLVLTGSALSAADNVMNSTGDSFNISGKLGEVQQQATASSELASQIVVAILFLAGLVFVAWGFYQLFIDEDRQKEGKKVKGGLKILGGFAWMLIMVFVKWMTS